MLDPVTAGPEVATLPTIQGLVDALPRPGDLLDGRVADGMDAYLEPGEVRAVEELRELVVTEIAGPAPLVVGERLEQPRRPGPDRPVDREVAPDPDGPLLVRVFKTAADPFVGRLTYLRVLHQQAYVTGKLTTTVLDERITLDAFEPIIARDLWDRVQATLNAREK